MADPILEAAFTREAELLQELEKIQAFIKTYRALALTITPESANTRGTNAAQSTGVSSSVDNNVAGEERAQEAPDAASARRVRVRDNPKPEAVVAEAVAVIREAGKPLTRRQIHEALTARGMEVKGADAIKALGTMLWRSGRDHLVQLEGYGYWDKSQCYLPAEYDPDPMFDLSKRGADDPGLGGPNY